MISLELQLKGYDQILAANRMFAKRLPNVILNAIRRPLRRKVTKIKQRIRRETGIGQAVFGGKGKGIGLDKVVKVITPKLGTPDIGERTLVTGVSLKGLPALIEQGGRTKPHTIRRAWGRATVNHPGAPVRAHNIAKQEMSNAGQEVLAAVSADVATLAAKTHSAA